MFLGQRFVRDWWMAQIQGQQDAEQIIAGRLVGVGGKADLASVPIWFAYQPVDGNAATARTMSDADGSFTFDVPDQPLTSAVVGAEIEGAQTVDLEPAGERLDPGELVLVIDDLLPSHLRYA